MKQLSGRFGVVVGKRVNGVSAASSTCAPASAAAVRPIGAPNWRAADHSHGRAGDAARWLELLAPVTLPPGCERVVNDEQSKWYRLRLAGAPLRLILEIEIWQGELWAHLAITGRDALPSAVELGYCRDLFLGDRRAIQIFPTKLEAAEVGSRTAHLYAPLESDALPSFSRACFPRFTES